ncbi:MAG: HAD family phosphatase [Phycisphaerae bacterium]|nr:HAD family phosphatase [Phycisphaerae bacterium]
MLKAVIFDFDGVISDSEPCHFAAYNKVLADFGIQIKKEEYYAEYLGFTDYEAFEEIKKQRKIDFKNISIEHLIERKAEVFKELIGQGGHLIDGVVELVAELKKSNIKIAINSGATAADIKVMLAGSSIENSFDIIVSADDVSKGKPDPEGYLLALKKLNAVSESPVSAKQCVVIEDSHWGIISAKKAAMHIIAVTNSYAAEGLKDADMIINSARQLKIDTLRKLCAD